MPPIRFYNSLTHSLEAFTPIAPPEVSMYNCGPTVYDFAHIGNFRAFLFADLLRRFLGFTGHRVHQVMNLTDVGHMTEDTVADATGEDKMALAARRLKEAKKSGRVDANRVADPDDPYQVARYFIDAFIADARALRLLIADEYPVRMPRATEHIDAMQSLIGTLLDKGHAYIGGDGVVYYSVESFPEYGRLSGNTLDRLRAGAGGRVSAEHQAAKRHPADFFLWKPDATHLMRWPSPWGEGYPGWHIECSAMAMKLLGRQTLDIHTGGEDNIFPHHECEIAQSTAATGEPFARYWLHTRFLLVEGEKMSKSRGNFYTVRDVLGGKVTGREVDPAVLRYELTKAHYRKNADFTRKGLEDSASAVRRLREAFSSLRRDAGGRVAPANPTHPTLTAFTEALADDLNVSGALAAVFAFIAGDHKNPAESVMVLREVDRVLGVIETGEPAAAGTGDIAAKAAAIDAARNAKDFATADRLRQELVEAGYEVKTTKQGTVATKKLA
jgi:cysteinyl-tRNA synthetase